MKTLKDILEKLKIDDIVLGEKFPIDGIMDDMIAFLENEGFKRIQQHTLFPSQVFNFKKDKCLYISDDQIFFADTSKKKISENNPLFLIGYSPEIYNVYYVDPLGDTIDIVVNNKKKFLEEVNKQFGWK